MYIGRSVRGRSKAASPDRLSVRLNAYIYYRAVCAVFVLFKKRFGHDDTIMITKYGSAFVLWRLFRRVGRFIWTCFFFDFSTRRTRFCRLAARFRVYRTCLVELYTHTHVPMNRTKRKTRFSFFLAIPVYTTYTRVHAAFLHWTRTR